MVVVRYDITESEAASNALDEISANLSSKQQESCRAQLRLVSMKESFDLELLTRFYNELMIPNFPLEEERDDLDDWIYCLDPSNSTPKKKDHNPHPSMDVILLVHQDLPVEGPVVATAAGSTRIVAGVAFEYYKQAQCGLLSYMVVSNDFRRLGIMKSLHPVACYAMELLHQEHYFSTTKGSETNDDTSSTTTVRGPPAIKAILAETNTPDAGDVPPAVIRKRHEILFQLGYRHLKFPYVQPALAENTKSFDEIILLIYTPQSSIQSLDSNKATTIDTSILYDYVVDFFQSVTGYDNDSYKNDWYYQLVEWFRNRNVLTTIAQDLPWEDITQTLKAAKDNLDAATAKTQLSLPGEGLSKNRRKKLEKRERARQKKLERKATEKAKRLEAAIAQGRDLAVEQRFVEERTASGDRRKRLDDLWNTKEQDALEEGRFGICIDLGARSQKHSDGSNDCGDEIRANFELAMREREIASLAQQIRYCYSYNKKSPNPVLAAVTGLTRSRNDHKGNEDDSSPTLREILERETGFAEWRRRMFDCTEHTLEEYYNLTGSTRVQGDSGVQEFSSTSSLNKNTKKLVYLTSDSPNTLEHLDNNTVYVIGGVVDRNRLKRATIDRAQDELKIDTAKLPLKEYLIENNISMTTTKVLTVNHVFDILLKYRQHGNDWNKAFRDVLPSRKV